MLQLDLQLQSEDGGDISSFITNGEWDLLGKPLSLRWVQTERCLIYFYLKPIKIYCRILIFNKWLQSDLLLIFVPPLRKVLYFLNESSTQNSRFPHSSFSAQVTHNGDIVKYFNSCFSLRFTFQNN